MIVTWTRGEITDASASTILLTKYLFEKRKKIKHEKKMRRREKQKKIIIIIYPGLQQARGPVVPADGFVQ